MRLKRIKRKKKILEITWIRLFSHFLSIVSTFSSCLLPYSSEPKTPDRTEKKGLPPVFAPLLQGATSSCVHCFSCCGAFLLCVFNLTIHYSRLSSVSKRGLWIVKDPRRLPATQRACFFLSIGPWATSSVPFCSAGCIGPRCEMWSFSSIRAWTGCRLRARSLARSVWWPRASTLWTRPCCLAVVGSHSCLRQLLARALVVNWTHLTSLGLCNG